MKLKSYILSMAVLGMLFACSDNDPIDPTKPNATLSILTDANSLTTKADDGLSTLGFALVYGDGSTTVANVTPTGTGKDETGEQPVKGGVAKIVVFANLSNEAITAIKAVEGDTQDDVMNQILSVTQKLDTETDSRLSMSSKVYDITLTLGKKHYLGYTTPKVADGIVFTGYTNPINLYRNVARVQVTGLNVQKDTKYGTASYFKLNYIFMANVKSQTKIGSVKAWDKVEATPPAADADAKLWWWYGAYPTITSSESYKTFTDGTQKDALLYTPTSDLILGTGNGTWAWASSTDVPYLGKSFQVYENQSTEKGYQTYLIVCGDYTINENGQDVEYTDRYWAVPVNSLGTGNATDYTGAGIESDVKTALIAHKGIRRNHIYSISLTISGRGSEQPYTPDATINLNAEVVVNPWSKLVDIVVPVE